MKAAKVFHAAHLFMGLLLIRQGRERGNNRRRLVDAELHFDVRYHRERGLGL